MLIIKIFKFIFKFKYMWVVGTSSTYFQKRDGKHSISNVKVSYKPNMGPGGCETLNLKL